MSEGFEFNISNIINDGNDRDLNLDNQISSISQNILNQNYNLNLSQSNNTLQKDEEITNPKTINDNLYFNSNQVNNIIISEPKIRRQSDKFDIARRRLKNLVLKNAFNLIQDKLECKYEVFQKKIC